MKICIFLSLFVLCSSFGTAQTGIVTNIAGNGGGHFTGDGGPATAAEIGSSPVGGVLDSRGNYYFSARFNHRVRKISPSGIITTVAGTGTRGYSGDGGAATAARLNNPNFLAIDSSDNLLIAEVEGARVRRVDATTGIITTFAGNGLWGERGDGGPATAANFHCCGGICVDRNQNVYVGTAVYSIRKIDALTGIITTVANTDTVGHAFVRGDGGPATTADFKSLEAICADTAGNLYIADRLDARIRKIDVGTGIITTFVGNDSFRYNGEGVSATSANIDVHSVTIGSSGDLFFSDLYNYRLRKIAAISNRVYTVTGTGIAGYSPDSSRSDTTRVYFISGIAADPCENIYFTEGGVQNYVKKITYPYGNQPGITITAQGGNTLCYPMPTTFTAHTTLAGSAPVYQWRVNGSPVGTSAPTYTYTPANGDSIDCILTSNLYCVVNPRDTSNVLHMSVFSLTPLSLALSGTASAVVGDTAVVTASITGTGLGAYTITWYKNGVWLDTTSTTTLRYIKPAGDDTITAVLVSHSRNCYDSVVAGHVVRVNVGVEESGVNKAGVTLWPNPVSGILHVSGLSSDGNTITLYDLLGRELLRSEVAGSAGEVNLSGLVSGVYVVQVCDMGSGVRVVRRVRVE